MSEEIQPAVPGSVSYEPDVVPINADLVDQYRNLIVEDSKLLQEIGAKSYTLTQTLRGIEGLNTQREHLGAAVRELMLQIRDTTKLDRTNKEYELDILNGVFREIPKLEEAPAE